MKEKRDRIIAITALALGVPIIAAILFNGWKALNTEPEKAGTGAVASEASELIWVEETQLETNEDITLSLKEAVLGEALQKKELIVFTQNLSDIIKVTDQGRLPFNLSAKYQYIKYSGTATYTVDLSGIDENHLIIDEEAKTIIILIPHAVQKLDINEEETQADETEKIGIFSLGDLKQSEEERAEVISNVKANMEQKLAAEKTIEIADRMAKLSVWEIYQPVVSKISPEYSVVTEFVN